MRLGGAAEEAANRYLPLHLHGLRQLSRWAIQPAGWGVAPVPISGRIADEDAWTWDLLCELAHVYNEPPSEAKTSPKK